MKKYAAIQKQVGETPLQALEQWRAERGIAEAVPLAYAGRLDPMASGTLLILIGDECKKQDRYNQMDKEYTFSALFGIQTDTGDVLGMAETCTVPGVFKKQKIKKAARALEGNQIFSYPAYSSKPVEGKPLFKHAHEGTLGDIDIPKKQVQIYHLRYTGKETISRDELVSSIIQKIRTLHINPQSPYPDADFRKDDIIQRWQTVQELLDSRYTIVHFRAIVSSGTYIRALVPRIAEKLGTCGCAYHIHRTKIGRYHSFGPLGFWYPSF